MEIFHRLGESERTIIAGWTSLKFSLLTMPTLNYAADKRFDSCLDLRGWKNLLASSLSFLKSCCHDGTTGHSLVLIIQALARRIQGDLCGHTKTNIPHPYFA